MVQGDNEIKKRSQHTHDDVIKWKHFPFYWPFVRGIHRSRVNSSHKGQWRGVLMFTLICAWINGWVNNREAGDLRRHRARYDVIVMVFRNIHSVGRFCPRKTWFQFRWLKGYIYSSSWYHHQIGSISLSHCYHIFPWLCPWYVCYIIFCHLLYIHSGKTGILFSLLLCSWWRVQIVGCGWLADRIRLFVYNTISISSVCKIIPRHWTYKMPVRYILSSVWVRLSKFSQLSIIQWNLSITTT